MHLVRAFIHVGLIYHEWMSKHHDLAQGTTLPWTNSMPRYTWHIFSGCGCT